MKKFMSLFLALIMVCSLSTPAFALAQPQRVSTNCAICRNTFSAYKGVENAVTYQEYYHISDISGLENDTQASYGISEALCVGKYNGGKICKSCLENIINANWPYKTAVSYDGQGKEAYTVTVPASLTPGIIPGSIGVVKVEGTWASNRKLCVSAPSTVTLTNSIDGGTKELGVMFQGIAKIGDNTAPISVKGNIFVNKITNALFGTWTGTITYTVSMIDVT